MFSRTPSLPSDARRRGLVGDSTATRAGSHVEGELLDRMKRHKQGELLQRMVSGWRLNGTSTDGVFL